MSIQNAEATYVYNTYASDSTNSKIYFQWNGNGANGYWGWITEYPQMIPTTKDIIAASPGADMSRYNFSNHNPYRLDRQKGWLFEQEWLRAISANPKVVFVTAWNDWMDDNAIEPATSIHFTPLLDFGGAYGSDPRVPINHQLPIRI